MLNPELELLLESCKSEHTKKQYSYSLKKFFNFVGGQDKLPNDRKEIEDKIIEFIVSLKKEGMSMPECKRAKKDKAYEHEEISKLLEIADERCVLLFCY